MKRVILSAFLAIACAAHADVIYPQTSRMGTWAFSTECGVIGDIPDTSSWNVVSVTLDAGTDLATAEANTGLIYSAIAAVGSHGVVRIVSEGTFYYTGFGLDHTQHNRVIEGPGMRKLRLKMHPEKTGSPVLFSVTGGNDYGSSYNPQSTVTSLVRGSANITLADASGIIVGNMGRLWFKNDHTTPVIASFDEVRRFTAFVVAKSGNTVTLSSPLPHDYAAALAVGPARFENAFQLWRVAAGVGIRGIHFDAFESSSAGNLNTIAAKFEGAYGCWLQDVKISGCRNHGLLFEACSNITLRTCEIREGFGGIETPNHSGILMQGSSNILIEDTIAVDNFPDVEMNHGCSNVVFGYCVIGALNYNHAPHNSHILAEGTVILGAVMSDGYFGGSSEFTDHRNWHRGGNIGARKRFTRNDTIYNSSVGFVGESYYSDYSDRDGKPNIGNEDHYGQASLMGVGGASPWPDFDSTDFGNVKKWVGTVTSKINARTLVLLFDGPTKASWAANYAANGFSYPTRYIDGEIWGNHLTVIAESGNSITVEANSTALTNTDWPNAGATGIEMYAGPPGGFKQLDLDVGATIDRKNVYTVWQGTIDHPIAPGDSFPASYYRTSKPAWFGDKAWPPIGPQPYNFSDTPTPAMHRYLLNNEDYLGDSGTPSIHYAPKKLRVLRR